MMMMIMAVTRRSSESIGSRTSMPKYTRKKRLEATMWMDRFALTLNGSQELPRLLTKAKAMADTYSAPEEIHGLLDYCQHMIDLMAYIIRNR